MTARCASLVLAAMVSLLTVTFAPMVFAQPTPTDEATPAPTDTPTETLAPTPTPTDTAPTETQAPVETPTPTATPACGNNILDSGEQCDDGNTLSGDCCDNACQFELAGSPCAADSNPCTDDVCNGTGTCNVNNTTPCSDGNACTDGDQCSGGTCVSGLPLVCDDGNPCNGVETCDVVLGCQPGTPPQVACGDGIRCGAEVCDDGNLVEGDGCDSNCTLTGCGNGIVTAGEQCDDGNTLSGDCCDGACHFEPVDSPCEADGNLCTTDKCNATGNCAPGSSLVCDDGDFCNGAETCDPGSGCQSGTPPPAICGDGHKCEMEECDDGGQSATCDADCTPAACGDGTTNAAAGELCDDGALIDGDGCDSNCTPTGCGNGIVTSGEQCDDGNLTDGDGCDSNCTQTGCGNDVVTAGEQCDDGNSAACDGCSNLCVSEPQGASWCLVGGPEGGRIWVVVTDRQSSPIVYAGTTGTVFRSADGGENWVPVDQGIRGAAIQQLAVDPSDPATVLAATGVVQTATNGVFLTSNAGADWSRVLNHYDTNGLVFDPTAPGLALLASYWGLSRSTDAGRTWVATYTAHGADGVTVDPQAAKVYAWVGEEGGRLYESADTGTTWAKVSDACLPALLGCYNSSINAIIAHPATSGTLFAVGQSVWRTADAGSTWIEVLRDTVAYGFRSLVLDPANPDTLYAGRYVLGSLGVPSVLRSDDGGDTWTSAGLVDHSVISLAVSSDATSVFSATNVGVYRSRDRGVTWIARNHGLLAASITALAPDPTTRDRIYAGTAEVGLWVAEANGANWHRLDTGFIPSALSEAPIRGLAVDPTQPSTLYVGGAFGIWKSVDFGTTWREINDGLPSNYDMRALAIDPQEPMVLYAGVDHGCVGGCSVYDRVFKSVDAGATWFAASPLPDAAPISTIAIDPLAPATILAGSDASFAKHIYKSTDGGLSWFAYTWTSIIEAHDVHQIAFDPDAPSTVYLATNAGVYRSLDGGETWLERVNGMGRMRVMSVLVDPRATSVVYAAVPGTGLFVSTDRGDSWNVEPDPGLTNAFVRTLAAVPVGPPASASSIGARVLPQERRTQAAEARAVAPGAVWVGAQASGGVGGVYRRDQCPVCATATPAPTVTSTPMKTETPTRTATATAPTPTPMLTRTATPILTATPTLTPTPNPTPTLTPTPDPAPTLGPLDHFTCYMAGATAGSAKFLGIPIPPGVALTDQFGSSIVEVKKPKFLCAPTNKLGEDPTARTHPEHFEGYQIKNPQKPLLPPNLQFVDQFNPSGLFLDAKKQSHLLVPTVKSLSTTPPTPALFGVDHFQCYKATTSKGTGKFVPVLGVEIEDQFGIIHVDVKKPKYLCAPVDKNNDDPTAPDHLDHLVCYQVKQVNTEARFVKVTGLGVNNQFGPETLDAKKPSELCVPALRNP